MITLVLFEIAYFFAEFIFMLLPDFEPLPLEVTSIINNGLVTLIRNSLSIVTIFVDYDIFLIALRLVFASLMIKPMWCIITFIFSKIPILNIRMK